jgi:hypothetical protein
MATTTFQRDLRSYKAGTRANHLAATRNCIMLSEEFQFQDADGSYKLPSINTNANGATAGDTDYNNLNNVGATFMFYIDTLATDVQIITDGVDRIHRLQL